MTPDPIERGHHHFVPEPPEPGVTRAGLPLEPRPLRPMYAAEVAARLDGLESAMRGMADAFNGNAELLAILMQRLDHVTSALVAAGIDVPVPLCAHPEDGVRRHRGALYCSTCGSVLRRADGSTPR